MHFTPLAVLCGLVASAAAHFQLQFPPPRGPFVEDAEPTFCDGYPALANSTRTDFPLSGGFISINSEHPKWVLGVELSTVPQPTSFQNFSGAVPFFQVTGEGKYCFPVDFASSGISGLQHGSNITIQLVFDGGDGQLYQCADLTLRSGLTLSNTSSCTNATGDTVQTATGISFPSSSGAPAGSSSGSSGAPAPSQSSPSGAGLTYAVSGAAGIVSFVGALLAVL
ncbi:hypothetical protein BDW22DRAFT_1419020 [Trametopsis cervina]|nr:hypothetical protein BDW22DRAFT_1419020 [Trametopsis cervina]